MVYRPTCRIPNMWRVNVNYLLEGKTTKIPIMLRGSIPELEWSQLPKLMHYITFQFSASSQVSLSLLQHAPLKPKQTCWGRNRKDRVSSGFLIGNLNTVLFSPTQATCLVNITLHLINTNNYLLIIKPTWCTNFSNLFL